MEPQWHRQLNAGVALTIFKASARKTIITTTRARNDTPSVSSHSFVPEIFPIFPPSLA
jgi:hypothetical protein